MISDDYQILKNSVLFTEMLASRLAALHNNAGNIFM